MNKCHSELTLPALLFFQILWIIPQKAVRWVLGEGGNVEVLEPQWLREKICTLAKKTAKVNRV